MKTDNTKFTFDADDDRELTVPATGRVSALDRR
jgi:hypothetical protein